MFYLRVGGKVPGFDPMLSKFNHLYVFHPRDHIVVPVRGHTPRLPRPHGGLATVHGVLEDRNLIQFD